MTMRKTRRFWIAAVTAFSIFAATGGAFIGESPAANLVVRVHDGDRFVDDLDIEDFEILEDGQSGRIEALYLVRGRHIVRSREIRPFEPETARHFFLLFQSVDYDPKFGEAIDHLFKNILRPGDAMTLMTPIKAYTLNPEALSMKTAASLSREMQQILRKDIQSGGGDYRDIIKDLRRMVTSIGWDSRQPPSDIVGDPFAGNPFGIEMQLDRYKQNLMKLDSLRLVDEKRMLGFASSLRNLPGRKPVFFFYQREFRPEISPQALSQMMSMYMDEPGIINDLQDLFIYYRREAPFESRKVVRAFSDAGISLNFIYMNKEAQYIYGAIMREQSEDIYSIFTDIAQATGGRSVMSQNLAVSFKSASQADESYYLIYYTPPSPESAGPFRTVEVRVPGRSYGVTHRLGYLAD